MSEQPIGGTVYCEKCGEETFPFRYCECQCDQQKEKCKVVPDSINLAQTLERMVESLESELLKREQREEKLVECLKNAMPILEGCQCLGSKGSKERHELTNQITSLLKELGYE